MSVAVVGINHRTVPLEELEPLIVASGDLPKALADLAERPYLDEVVVLSTCMRTEIYAVVNRFHGAMADIREFLAAWSGQPPEEFSGHLYSYFDDGAIAHLFRVAAGLDSASVGEPEVLGQVRTAWEVARREETCGQLLGAAFSHAVQVGKRARTETAIARGSTSVAYAAAELAARALGTDSKGLGSKGLGSKGPGSKGPGSKGPGSKGLSCLVVGLGEVGETAARALADLPGVGEVLLVNRTEERARELASQLGGRALPWQRLHEALAGSDIVVCSTAGDGILVSEEAVRRAMSGRPERAMAMVDLAVPRDIDPAAGAVPGVTLLNMDDVGRYVAARVGDRQSEVPDVERIVAEEVERYNASVAARSVAPLVTALHEWAEQVRQNELSRAGSTPMDAAEVDALTRRIVAKLLHSPTVNLKAAAGTTKADALADAFRDLFGLRP